ncbi:unnamed protein product [Echinostoma caproni]|uniref:Fork-head domain-containing protein n=1 Tax=Echinostoma caproni TaxID=27848 RepID=A0A183AX79_9TREM|nr:unnamed protein product [Echinostoma caproni]
MFCPGRATNGKGHYWSIHPANMQDFLAGDYRRRRAQRKVRQALGLACPNDPRETPSPPAVVTLTRKERERYYCSRPLSSICEFGVPTDISTVARMNAPISTTEFSYYMSQLLPHFRPIPTMPVHNTQMSDTHKSPVFCAEPDKVINGHPSLFCSVLQRKLSLCALNPCESLDKTTSPDRTEPRLVGQNGFSVARILAEPNTQDASCRLTIRPKMSGRKLSHKDYLF